jgi:MoaA/NifB/PqqE/SkfB family radical SAM enzyme
MSLAKMHEILRQARALGTIEEIYFEGGEPFLNYAVLIKGVKEAAATGFKVGVVSNGFWATDVETAREWLRPLAGLLVDLSLSNDLYHCDDYARHLVENAVKAAHQLAIPVGEIAIAQPETADANEALGQLPTGESRVMYRGRATVKLIERAYKAPSALFTTCPYENLRDPGRIHVDPFGYLHLCQGLVLGNMFEMPLAEIWANYDPDTHPIVESLVRGGPVALAEEHGLQDQRHYADACHLCYTTRLALREVYPDILVPDQMYGSQI